LSAWRPGAYRATAFLAAGVLLTLLGVGGGRALWWMLLPRRADDPRHEREEEVRRVRRPDGTELQVEVCGRADGPAVVLTPGWGATTTEWYYLRRQLGDRYRLVAWDLPGLGLSRGPDDRNYGLDKMAGDLKAVLDEVVGGPAVLLGHSMGGMIALSFAKRYPAELGARVVGLVLIHTTHTNPVRTTQWSALYTALQKPVLEPLAYLMIGLAPLVWAMNALSYLNGTLHASIYRQLFSWTGTWGQLEFASRYALQIWPASYARGTLGMFRYHATDALAGITVPTLVVAADRDKMTRPEASEEIRAAVPRAELVTLTPAGHMGLIQRHEEFGGAVRAFVDRCLSGAR
jgi:pimeloyl-ACP methyl ester carboxylesterase